MPLALQVRLLSVLEDREVMPLGGNKVISVDVRIVGATQHDPLDMVAKGQFREDLYYRLNGITVRLPPLRQRTDKAGLIRKLLASECVAPVEIEPELLERLVRHSWPGNVRQLRNVLRTMLALRSGERLTLADFKEQWLAGGVEDAAHGEARRWTRPPTARARSAAPNAMRSGARSRPVSGTSAPPPRGCTSAAAPFTARFTDTDFCDTPSTSG